MKPEPAASAQGAVAELIRRYLTEHPRAADTAEGVQRWWLAPTYGEVPLGSVEQALAQLEGEGVVRKLDPFASIVAYGRGPNFVGSGAGGQDGL
jgi:hypothetical protein